MRLDLIPGVVKTAYPFAGQSIVSGPKKQFSALFLMILGLACFISFQGFAQNTVSQDFTTPGTTNFNVPAGVTSVEVQIWGAGGGASGRNTTLSQGGGGGGGGGYRGGRFAVSGGSISVTVGNGGAGGGNAANGGPGGNSSITYGGIVIVANGGARGTVNTLAVGQGGAGGGGSFTGAVTNQVSFNGGDGGNGDNDEGGAGGGGAGSEEDGEDGADAAGNFAPPGGDGGADDGGDGGNGGNDGAGQDGDDYGGGGGASGDDGGTSGDGGVGKVTITYYALPNITGFTVNSVRSCAGSGAVVTVTAPNLVTDTYVITYAVTGTLNSITSTTVTVPYTAGAGSFSFVTSVLPNAENDVLQITRVTSNTTSNFSTLTSNTNFTVNNCRVWYSYQSGVFNDLNTWTLDPSGTTFDNGLGLTPANNDEIHILNGHTVTVNQNNRILTSTKINGGGVLDMGTSTSNDLGVITGTGLLRVRNGGTSFPTGTYQDFVSSSGGTIEYYNAGGTFSTAQAEYNNLKITNSTGANIIYVLAGNITVNGNFEISATGAGTATWQINDTNNTQRTITLKGDLTVGTLGRILAGTGNPANAHNLTMYGNFVNDGIVQFFSPTSAPFNGNTYTSETVLTAALTGRAVNVTFSGTADQTVTLNNQTDFYRFIVNKGTTQQPMITVNSSAASNMRLWGPNDLSSTNAAVTSDQVGYSSCALSIINGTLQLTGTLTIPTLIEKGTVTAGQDFFKLPITSCLWLNSPGVNVTLTSNVTGDNDDQRLMVNGLFRVSNGSTFHGGFSRGIGAGAGGTTLIEGPLTTTVTVWQFRPLQGGTEIIAFTQTGGTFNVGNTYADSGGPIDFVTATYARFDLGTSNCSFTMSGGEMNVAKATDAGGFIVESSAGNYSVTGGTINLYVDRETTGNPTYGGDNLFVVTSTAPLYNVNVYHRTSAQRAQLQGYGLVVQNNFKLIDGAADPTFSCNNLNLTVGGDFDVQAGTTLNLGTLDNPGTPGVDEDLGTNTITINGAGLQAWTNSGTISNLTTVVINKSANTLNLGGTNAFPTITASPVGLNLQAGTLNDQGKTLTVTGALSNSAIHTGTGVIIYDNPGASNISGNNGVFGNLTINTNNTVTMQGNQTVTGILRLLGANSTLDIGNNALRLGSGAASPGYVYSNGTTGVAFTATKRIRTSGLHNAGGLTRYGAARDASNDLLFPVGTGTLYTPNTIRVTAGTHGTITVRPVNSEHPNVTAPTQSLQYYWRVTSTGYTGITAVSHRSYAFNDVNLLRGTTGSAAAQQQNYRQARFDATTFLWSYNNVIYNAEASTVIQNFNTGTNWYNITGDQLDGEYTCGHASAFDIVKVYYSRNQGVGPWNWNSTSSWTYNTDHATGTASELPCATCPVIIGNGSSINHAITINANNITCGILAINAGSTLDCGTFTALDFGINTTGSGTLRVAAINTGVGVFPTGDFVTFLGTNGGTVEWYGNSKILPTTYTSPAGSQNLNTYYNLVLNPSAAQTLTLPPSNLTIYNNLVQGRSTFGAYTGTVSTNSSSRTIDITGKLDIGAGTFNFASTATSATTLNVTGNVEVTGTLSRAATTGNQTNTHTVTTASGIINNGTINFREYTNATRFNVVDLTFTGTNSVQFSGTGATTLNLLTVNKGTSQAATVTFNTSGAVTTTAAADGWLKLQNGTFDFANTGTIATNLSSDDYLIPSTAKLRVSGANVTVNTTSTDANANDLFLNGAIEVAGGILNVGSRAAGTTNHVDIEYASAGSPTILVSNNADVWVRGSVRRSTAVITGALVYNQSGTSIVTIGGIAASSAPNNTRGVFEIDHNSGSNFTLLNTAQLNVQRQTNGGGYADLYINPSTSNVSASSTITLGLGTATTQNNLRVYVVPTIGNFTIQNGGSTNAQTALLYNDLALGGTLTIPSPSLLDATASDPDANVTLAGNFVCGGTYTAGTNTTTFTGGSGQSAVLTSTTNFYDVTVDKSAGNVLLSGTAPAVPGLNNLSILAGTLEVGSISTPLSASLKVNRNIIINGSQIGTQPVEVYSTVNSNTITSTGGSFTNLTLGGTAGNQTITVVGNLTINGQLNFATTSRYLMVGSYRLTFGSAATVSGAGANAFVRTNGVATDLGVTKTLAATGVRTFTYPIGTSTNYTPVTVSLNVTGTGDLTVLPVNSAHLTYNQASTERILNYYWNVSRSASLTATASGNPYLTFTYPSTMITGTGGTLVAAYLDPESNPLGWARSSDIPTNGGAATTTQMTFSNTPATNFPVAGKYYDYSVGTPNTLPNPILPLYSRLGTSAVLIGNGGGNWTTNNSWTTETDGDPDNSAPAYTSAFSGPRGVPIVILPGARINMDQTGRRAYKTTVNGLLYSGTSAGATTTGHNLGTIDGTGVFRTATNTFPAGDYVAFVASTGGTIEYEVTATNNPFTMNSVSLTSSPGTVTYNNLSIRLQGVASGTVNMTDDNVIINGNLTIPAGGTLANTNNRNITIYKQWSNSGTFTPGTGTVSFSGADPLGQTITGATTFYNLTVSKPAGNLTLANSVSVSGALTLTNGHLISTSTNLLQLGMSSTSSGGSTNSFVSGPIARPIFPGTSFNFPLGSIAASRYRPAAITAYGSTETWNLQYVGNDPTTNAFPNESINMANIGAVSNFEYWLISRPGTPSADVTLSYNTGSYRADVGNVGDVTSLRVAKWGGAQWDLPPGATGYSQSGSDITGTVTVTGVTSFSPTPFTLASLHTNSPLPIVLLSFTARVAGDKVSLQWSTSQEVNNQYFTVVKTVDFESFQEVGRVESGGNSQMRQDYSMLDERPYVGRSYYRLKQTDFDGEVTFSEPVMIEFDGSAESNLVAYPNPFDGAEIEVEITGLKGLTEVPVVVYDQRGVVVYETILLNENSDALHHKIFFQTKLSSGLYIIKSGKKQTLVKKLIVK